MDSLQFRSRILYLSFMVVCTLSNMLQVLADEGNNLEVWRFKTNGKIRSTPIIDNDAIFVGSDDGVFYALNSQTGDIIWQFQTDCPVRSNGVIVGNMICFESGNVLYAIDVQSGLKLWETVLVEGDVTNEIDAWDYFRSSPLFVDGVIYIGSEQGVLKGVDVSDGSVVFQYQTDIQSTIRIPPLWMGGALFFGDWAGTMYCVDVDSDSLLWRLETGKSCNGPAVTDGQSIFIGGRSTSVFSIDAQTGTINWQYTDPIGSWICAPPVIVEDRLFIGGSDNHSMLCFDKETGELIWETEVDFNIFTKPIVQNGKLFFGSGDSYNFGAGEGSIYVTDIIDGHLVNRMRTTGNVFGSLCLVGNLLYFGSEDSSITAIRLDLLSGKPIANIHVDESKLDLGTLEPTHTEEFQIDIINTGTAGDSVKIDIYYSNKLDSTGFLVTPLILYIAPDDTETVSVQIEPRKIQKGTYRPKLYFDIPNNLGNVRFTKPVQFKIAGISDVETGFRFPDFEMQQAYPNPFNMTTRIDYQLGSSAYVTLDVFNVLGQKIKTLVQDNLNIGFGTVVWDGTDEGGKEVGTGNYCITMKINKQPYKTQLVSLIK